jgi:hypothetical protein
VSPSTSQVSLCLSYAAVSTAAAAVETSFSCSHSLQRLIFCKRVPADRIKRIDCRRTCAPGRVLPYPPPTYRTSILTLLLLRCCILPTENPPHVFRAIWVVWAFNVFFFARLCLLACLLRLWACTHLACSLQETYQLLVLPHYLLLWVCTHLACSLQETYQLLVPNHSRDNTSATCPTNLLYLQTVLCSAFSEYLLQHG